MAADTRLWNETKRVSDVLKAVSDEGLGRRFVLRPTALVIGRQAVAKVLPCFLLDR